MVTLDHKRQAKHGSLADIYAHGCVHISITTGKTMTGRKMELNVKRPRAQGLILSNPRCQSDDHVKLFPHEFSLRSAAAIMMPVLSLARF